MSVPFLSGAAELDPSVRAPPCHPQNCPLWVHVVGSTVATGGNVGPGEKDLPKCRPQLRPPQIYLWPLRNDLLCICYHAHLQNMDLS